MTHPAQPPAGADPGRSNPLDEIRMAEARAARLVEQARLAAEACLAAARQEAERRRQAALAAGQQAGQLARQQQERAAEEEAARIQMAAERAAGALRRQGQAQVAEAAAWAVGVVLGEVQATPAPAPHPAAGHKAQRTTTHEP